MGKWQDDELDKVSTPHHGVDMGKVKLSDVNLRDTPDDMILAFSAGEVKSLLQQADSRAAERERSGYGRGTIDTLEHVKLWADKAEVSYNDMMQKRINTLKGDSDE